MITAMAIDLKKKTSKSKTSLKPLPPPFSEKLPFIRSLILDSVEPETVKKIYLFGSYAYGKPTSKSDIDLCIIIDNNQDDIKTYMKIAINLYNNDIIPADILLYKENEFFDFSKSSGIENIIFKKGKILYG